MIRLHWYALLSLGCVWCWAPVAPGAARAAEAAKVAVAQQAPPAELAEEIRAALRPEAVRIAEGDQPLLEFWFRQEIPLAGESGGEAAALTALKPGTLLGAIKVHQERYDFKDEEIPPGVYTLRFALQPVDGAHLGTSPTETFALLVPAKDDRRLQAFADPEALGKASSKINAAEHPSNLNLQPVAEPDGEFPRLAVQQGGKHKVVCLQLSGKPEGSSPAVPLRFALVYEGTGEI